MGEKRELKLANWKLGFQFSFISHIHNNKIE